MSDTDMAKLVRETLPFLEKPHDTWTADERIVFNYVMEQLMTGRTLAIHEEIMSFSCTPEGQANARLIAAAPEMYRLLQNFAYPEEPITTRTLNLSNRAWELLRRIDGEEEEHDAD